MSIKKTIHGRIWTLCTFIAVTSFADSQPIPLEDGYVESLGRQFVNLRAFKTPNTRVWIDFQTTYEFDGGYHSILGTDGNATGGNFNFYVDADRNFYFLVGEQPKRWISAAPYDMKRHTMDLALNVAGEGQHRVVFTTGSTTNLDVITTTSSAGTTTKCPLMLFGKGGDYSNAEYASETIAMKVYGVKIWEGTELVHDYVPRKVEGKFCFKDLIDGQYVMGVARADGNVMEEVLSGGGDIVEEPGDAYIESHNHERIDLGIKADGTTRVELDHQLVGVTNLAVTYQSEGCTFGSMTADNDHMTFWGCFARGGKALGYECTDGRAKWGDDQTIPMGADVGITPTELRRTLVIDAPNKKVAYLTAGYEGTVRGIPGTYVNETEDPLGLFMTRVAGGWGSGAKMRFYGMNIYKNGTLVKKFTPYIKSALPGVIDQDGIFRTTDDAESMTDQTFAIGGAITGDAGMDDVYLETTGNEYVDSGIVPTATTKVVMDFALLDPDAASGGYLFGVRDSDVGPFFWAGMDSWLLGVSTSGTKWQWVVSSDHVLNRGRYELTVDAAAQTATLKQCGVTVATRSGLASAEFPTTSMGIMGLRVSADELTAGSMIRFYSFKVYEGDALVSAFYPTRFANGNIGLYDTERKIMREPTQTAGMKLRGRTIDGIDQGFTQTPPAKVELFRDDSVTLTATAPYATSYVWRRNGVVIRGVTGSSCEVRYDGERKVAYSVAPVYTVNRVVGSEDVQVEGVPTETEVVFPIGMAIIVR